ncbi:MAG: hypothetical protein ACTSXE_04940 [Candidatus Thorarchaeota archaeon]
METCKAVTPIVRRMAARQSRLLLRPRLGCIGSLGGSAINSLLLPQCKIL